MAPPRPPKSEKRKFRYIFLRGNVVWYTFKSADGEWRNHKTRYVKGQEEEASRYVESLVRQANAARAAVAQGEQVDDPALTVRAYCDRRMKEREGRGLITAGLERSRVERYILPVFGDYALVEVRPKLVTKWVRDLIARAGDEKLAPRTIHHLFNLLHGIFEDAVVEELVLANPVKVKAGTLPRKVDGDLEWRPNATFMPDEVERLISEPIIPVERRVMYALKALAGLRHGEAAALCWRHIDYRAEPFAKINVVQAYSTTKKKIKSTKSEEAFAVPVHPTLRAILDAWRTEHWARVYGREPTLDDLIIPARTGACIDGADAVHAFHDDLDALGLRKEAGKKRRRGGHDLRAFYETWCVEGGADSLIIDRTMHAPPKSVAAGYQRFSWATVCREVGKLKVGLIGGKALPLLGPGAVAAGADAAPGSVDATKKFLTGSLHSEKRAGARWTCKVTPKGLEAGELSAGGQADVRILDGKWSSGLNTSAQIRTSTVRSAPYIATASKMLEKAIMSGDTSRALRIARELRGEGAKQATLERKRGR